MDFKFRDENCIKKFSTKFNRNKHDRNKEHAPGNVNTTTAIPYDTSEKSINVLHLVVPQPENINKTSLSVWDHSNVT